MRPFPGILSKCALAALLVGAFAAVGLLYLLSEGPQRMDMLAPYLKQRLEAALPGTEAEIPDILVQFVPGEASVRVRAYDVALRPKEKDGAFPRIRIPVLSAHIRLLPGGGEWLTPTAEMQDVDVAWGAFPEKEGKPPSRDAAAVAAGLRRAVERTAPLSFLRSLCARDVTLRFAGADGERTRSLAHVCVKRRRSLDGRKALNVATEIVEGEKKARLLLSVFTEGDKTGVNAEIDGLGAKTIRGLPFAKEAAALLPSLSDWEFSGDANVLLFADGRPEEASLKADRVKASFDRFFAKKEKTTLLLRDLDVRCRQSCRRISVARGRASMLEADVNAGVHGDLTHDANSLALLLKEPERLKGEAGLTLSGMTAAQLYAILDGVGLDDLRDRMQAYLPSGTLSHGTLSVRFPEILRPSKGKDKRRFLGDFVMKDAELRVPQHGLSFQGISAGVHIDPETARGDVLRADYKSVRFKDIAFTANFRAEQATAEGTFAGTFADAGGFIPAKTLEANKTLAYLARYGKGDAEGKFFLRMPTRAGGKGEKKAKINAQVRNLAMERLFPQTDVVGGTADVEIVAGKSVSVVGRIATRARTDEGAPSLVAIPPSVLAQDGDASLDLRIETSPPAEGGAPSGTLALVADVTESAVSVPVAGYQKYPGDKATFVLEGKTAPGRFSVSRMEYESGASRLISRKGEFSPQGFSLSVERAAFGRHDAAADVAYETAKKALDVEATKGDVDAEALWRYWKERKKEGTDGGALDVRFALRQAFLQDGVVLTHPKGSLSCAGRFCRHVELDAGLGEKGGVRVRAVPPPEAKGNALRLDVTATEAGALLQALHLGNKVQGGRLELQADMAFPPAPASLQMDGAANLYDFKAVNMPIFGRILSLATLGGVADMLERSGISVDRLKLPFRYRDSVWHIKDATTSGASVGLTGEGTIDMKRRIVDVQGVVVPAQGNIINKLAAGIPFLGTLVTGGRNQGVIGINYAVSGPMDKPVVTANPLSILAPGILRKIFIVPEKR
jgi:hypothetical protein